MAGSGAPASLPHLGLLLAAAVTAQGGNPAPLPSIGLLLGPAAAMAQGGDPAPLPHLGLLLAAGATPPAPAPATPGYDRRKKRDRYDYLEPSTRERMAQLVREQREAMGILPRPVQQRVEAAVKKEARRAAPDIAELAPVAAEVAQDTGAALQAVIDAIAAAFQHQRGLVAARLEADAARRQEAEQLAAEQQRVEAEAAERAWQQRLVQLRAEDDELLRQDAAARAQAVETIRRVQQALLALIQPAV